MTEDRKITFGKYKSEPIKIYVWKRIFFVGNHTSFHLTCFRGGWEFHVLPFVDICWDRVLCGWLCFTMQISYYRNIRDDE